MKYKIGDKVRIHNVTDHRRDYNGTVVTIRNINPNGKTLYKSNITHYGVKEKDIGFVFWEDELASVPVNTRKIVITSDGVETLARLYDGNKVIKTATAKCSPDDTFDFEVGARTAFDRLIESPLTKALKSLSKAAADLAKNFKPFKFEVGKQYADGNNVIEITDAKNEGICFARYYYKDIKGDTGASKSFTDGSAFASRLTPYDPPKYFTGKAVCIKSDSDFTVGKIYEFANGHTRDDHGHARPNGYSIESFDEWKKKSLGTYEFVPIVE